MSSLSLLLALVVTVGAYVLIVALLPKRFTNQHRGRIKTMVASLEQEAQGSNLIGASIERTDPLEEMRKDPLLKVCGTLPGGENLLRTFQRAGMQEGASGFLLLMLVVWLVLTFVMLTYKLGALALIAPPLVVLLLGRMILNSRIKAAKRNMMDLFPDALDMIVRSLKSGYPVNTAFAIVSENIPAPMNAEFKRMLDEMSLGSPLATAIENFAERVDDSDARFFSVVVGIQQESGGNLSQILGTIGHVIRQRKHLKMRILALSADGRASAKVLIGLFILMLSAIQIISPTHLEPIWTTQAGNIVLAVVLLQFGFGIVWMRKIINIKV